MKTSFLCLALLLMSAATFAQTAFTQATLDGILAEYKANSKTFFTTRLSDDFRYTTPQGAYQTRKDIIGGEPQKILKTEIAEPVIFQSGDLAVVSGIHKTERTGPDGNASVGQIACTYTFQRRDNKWLFVGSQHTSMQPTQSASASDDEARSDVSAIKAVCTDFSEQWDKRNRSGVLAHLADVPYASRYWPNNAYNGSATVREAFAKAIDASPTPTGVKRNRSNWQLKPLGNRHYWATFSQVITAPDGSVKYGQEANLLEKINGEWKLVSVITLPMPKPE